jgi:glutamate synthase (NADPH/NADH) small chain
MGKPTGFLEYTRESPAARRPQLRIRDWNEFHEHFPEQKLRDQARAAWTAASRSATRASS